MRLEYLAVGPPDGPLIRLSKFTPVEAACLAAAVSAIASGHVERIAVHDLLCVSAVDGCKLFLRCLAWDQAIIRVGPKSFECGFTSETWHNVAGLIEPFSSGAVGHQWLAKLPGEASLLLSVNGQW